MSLTRKPFKHELQTTMDVLAWFQGYLEQHEPHAVGTIGTMRDAQDALPTEDELDEMEG